MGNIETTIDPDNHDIITIDISGITDEQRRLLKKCINYDEDSGVPLVAALLISSMNVRKMQMQKILENEAIEAVRAANVATVASL